MMNHEIVFCLDTYGTVEDITVEDGVVAMQARIMDGDAILDRVYCRWAAPTNRYGQAFRPTEGFFQIVPNITHDDCIDAHNEIVDFFNKHRERIDIYVDEAGQYHYKPFSQWNRESH